MNDRALLGDEAVALGALHAGIGAAYGYPGTPSTEIMEYLLDAESNGADGGFVARWSANEKTAFEEALGTSFCGRRALVTMKHVGLNVAADPFMNAALLDIKGGIVLAVADDPGMHSSQNEQDSRYFADFAMIPCLEPTDQQEAYDMTRRAFDLSEELSLPVMIRLVTRLSHSRAAIETAEPRRPNPLNKTEDRTGWTLIPAWARKRYAELIGKQEKMAELSETSPYNSVSGSDGKVPLGVITTGLARNYFVENAVDLDTDYRHLHIGQSPWPKEKIRSLIDGSERLLILEEGMPLLERYIRGIGRDSASVAGKLDGTVVRQGELNPDNVREALGLPARASLEFDPGRLPMRPPQLCQGCPHEDSYRFIKETAAKIGPSVVTSDIGCYALGVLPPLQVPETVVCMGASITMAKGAAEAGHPNVMAVIGDSTFYHSGLTGLVDCVADQAAVTIIIMDNSTVAMTGGQTTRLASARLPQVVEGLGVEAEHIHILDAMRKDHDANVAVLEKELAYRGPSVIITVRECLETLRKKRSAK
ncbi:MAG: thiamine pyrophosphate-dependent enzyme [Spirochaetaceae bacterium]|nr:thiamine pyrophosphate-dependent enzyme [Spirochaetaceae bacterium]